MVIGILVDKVKFEGVEGVGGIDHGYKTISIHRNKMCSAHNAIEVDNRDKWLPVLHFAFHSPHASDFIRFFTGLDVPLDEGTRIFFILELQGKKQQDTGDIQAMYPIEIWICSNQGTVVTRWALVP